MEFVQSGDYVAEVPVVLIEGEGPWTPRLSLEDVRKLEVVRLALGRGDVAAASKYGRVFALMAMPA